MNLMEKRELLYEGKAKKVFATDDGKLVIQEFKDSLTAFNAQKKGSFEGKGAVNLKITSIIFKYLASQGIKTHFVKSLNEKEFLVQKLQMVPLEVVVRNVVAGSLAARFGVAEGLVLEDALVEFYYKKDELNDPMITDDQVVALKFASLDDLKNLKSQARKVNQALKVFFDGIGVTLVDFKLEFGKNETGDIVLADEISPDSCRLWDKKTGEKLDKDRFRKDLGRVQESYELLLDRIIKKWGQS